MSQNRCAVLCQLPRSCRQLLGCVLGIVLLSSSQTAGQNSRDSLREGEVIVQPPALGLPLVVRLGTAEEQRNLVLERARRARLQNIRSQFEASIQGEQQPASQADFRLVAQSGEFMVDILCDYGGFDGTCTERDTDYCQAFADYPELLEYLGDADYGHCTTLSRGSTTSCHCEVCEILVSLVVVQQDAPNLATFLFDPSGLYGICGEAGTLCTPYRSEVVARAFNNLVLQVHDINSSYSGEVKIEGRISWDGTGTTSSPCETSGATVIQSILAEFSCPPATEGMTFCEGSNEFAVAAFSGLASWTDTANEDGGFQSGAIPSSGWAVLSQGVAQNEDFSVGFALVTEIVGRVLPDHAGALRVELRFSQAN